MLSNINPILSNHHSQSCFSSSGGHFGHFGAPKVAIWHFAKARTCGPGCLKTMKGGGHHHADDDHHHQSHHHHHRFEYGDDGAGHDDENHEKQ